MIKKFMPIMAMAMLLLACSNKDDASETSTSADLIPKDYRIALVSDPVVDGNQFILQAQNALNDLAKEHEFTASLMEANSAYEWIEGTKEFAEYGYDLIIGIGWQSGEAFSILQDSYSNTKFAVIDTVAIDEDIKSIIFNTAEGSYVLGVMIATALPNERAYGYIGNFQNKGNFEYRYGFTKGVNSINSTATIIFDYANSYNDKEAVYELAKKQLALGVRFIMGSVTSSANEGIYRAALESSKQNLTFYTSGLSVDQTTEENPYIISGLTKNTGVAVNKIVAEFIAGEFKPDVEILSVEDGGFGVIHITEDANYRNETIITDHVIEVAKAARDNVLNGKVQLILGDEDAVQN